ncbi:MAG TPA: ABC transporter ATP-binding protein [Deltaproteobacteria bacterium]|nr:MAG: ABC transporter ATP-binding protein [Deltaproteobacteria bacterium GWA2_55_82]OGQ64427.1 MAG: ABC transporter ATP-binding protein [Deltaproteobacteria bacterium RIFCSPLOWO2_02_FULL_55_12]OIJ72807.1 MAG: ABC transporter ATP-binding protein [Deltaproteobacteria bacterium GWC2_55_46]HBG46085.1 ABC transporter ATP-binding protein [Deltaproteobacteria bacterium]HCY11583.1 ABC transporter ATP-binding protein [Deltaproteobacteria bacterium]
MALLAKILFRNALRHRLRTALTVLGMAIAILAFGLLRTVVEAWYAGVEASQANRLITRNAISLVFPLPISYYEKIRQVEGVVNVSHGDWFGGVYKDERNFFGNFAMEAESHLDIVSELVLPEDERTAYLKDRKGSIAGRKLAERFGWETGDLITLKGLIYPGDWDFVLRGIYRGRDETVDESLFFFHWEYLNETIKEREPDRGDQTGFYLIQIARPELAALVAGRIDALFKNSLAETLTETERAFQMSFVSMTEAIMTAIQLVSFVVIIIIMAVTANTMAMSVRERLGEFAAMKTLGFGPLYLTALIFGESLVISFLGAGLGVMLTFPAAGIFKTLLGQYFPIFIIKPSTFYMDAAAAFLVAAVSAILPAYRAITVPITEALRRIA